MGRGRRPPPLFGLCVRFHMAYVKTLTDTARVLRGLNLTIRQGETLVVMGESGSGKTTLCRVLAGDLAFTGSVRLASDSVTYLTGIVDCSRGR